MKKRRKMKKLILFVSFLFIASGLYAVEVYSEPFTSDLSGVTTFSVSGAQEWHWQSYDSGCAKMSGYDGGQNANEDWLITPVIDLTNYTDTKLDFREAINYESDVSTYETIWASTNYSGTGDPTGATWDQLNVTGRSPGNTWSFNDVDQFDLSGYDGESTLYLGFKYLSTDTNAGTWEIGEIVVSATGSSPEITVDPTTLSGFSYIVGNGPSAEQSFDVSATNLTGNLTITAPTNYEISETSGSGYTSPITLTPTGGTVSSTTIYVRLEAGLPVGTYNNEDITASSTGATDKTVTCSGSVNSGTLPRLMISKVADPSDVYQARFVQLYNGTGSEIDFDSETWYLCRQANGSPTSWGDVLLTGIIAAGGIFNIAYNQSYFNTAWGFDPNQVSGNITGNGDDGYFLYQNGDHSSGTLVDAYGVIDQDGSGEPWEYTDSKAVRKAGTTNPNPTWTASEWDITSATTAQIDPSTTTLPVELSSFTAVYANEFVTIQWATASETDVIGFNIYRAYEDDFSQAEQINFSLIPGHGTTTQPNEYSFIDETANVCITYHYWLESVNYGGTNDVYGSIQYDPVDVDGDGELNTIIHSYIEDAYPNPVKIGDEIHFDFMIGGLEGTTRPVSLNIYNIKGELVKEIINDYRVVNDYNETWRVNDITKGVYFYQLKTENYQETKKLLIQ